MNTKKITDICEATTYLIYMICKDDRLSNKNKSTEDIICFLSDNVNNNTDIGIAFGKYCEAYRDTITLSTTQIMNAECYGKISEARVALERARERYINDIIDDIIDFCD